ncbi:aldo/keto reductase [Stachybotrys elegans]|uniref:Aldo/keto reductase n=1 Tax=Stachybotrys elegans TaxID=80388 RepID=A0A8K0WQB3_9HYPO|nr:aldo/keto reductase [Stachybotrys elegans]
MASPTLCTKAFELNNGAKIPAVGLGTWQGSPGSKDEEALEQSILHALKVGYRHLDTAQSYGIEHVVGRAIRASGVPRSEIFLVTKFWGHWHHDPATALDNSLSALGVDYVDVFLMHWPMAMTPDKQPLRPHQSPTFVETWKLMEELVGPKCRGIGVSNFTQKTLGQLLETAKVTPVINQVELHALNPNLKLVPWCQEHGIHVTSWSTLGGGGENGPLIRSHDVFTNIAKAHGCSPGVVSLSWAVQRGVSVIPKSATPSRIEENIKLVTLTDEEMEQMNKAYETIKSVRFANNIQSMHLELDGKRTLGGWSYVDMGWEDENGNWLV